MSSKTLLAPNKALTAIKDKYQQYPQLRLAVYLLLPGFFALLLGYVWPYHYPSETEVAARQWQWPISTKLEPQLAKPKLLARFWPLDIAKEATATTNASQAQWRLVAVIRQGSAHQALLLSPEGKLQTLSPGDQLDDNRQVSAILATELQWQRQPASPKSAAKQLEKTAKDAELTQHSAEQGSLYLFPKPDDAPLINTSHE